MSLPQKNVQEYTPNLTLDDFSNWEANNCELCLKDPSDNDYCKWSAELMLATIEQSTISREACESIGYIYIEETGQRKVILQSKCEAFQPKTGESPKA